MFEFWFTKYMVEFIISCGIGLILLLFYFIFELINMKHEKKKRERLNKKLKEFKEHIND